MPFFHGLVSTSTCRDAEGLKSKNRSRADGWRQFSAVFDTRSDRPQLLRVMPRKQAVYCRVFHREKWGRVRSPREQRHLTSQREKGPSRCSSVFTFVVAIPLWKVVRRFNERPDKRALTHPPKIFIQLNKKQNFFVSSSWWLIWNRVLARI